MSSETQTTEEREVFHFERAEGQYVRLIACGTPDASLVAALSAFIKARRKLLENQHEKV